MRVLKYILIGLVALVVLVLAVGFALPAKYHVERSLEIKAPAERVYGLVSDPKQWATWAVWNKRDPAMKVAYSGAPSGAGAKWSWESKTEGSGEMEFTRADPPKLIGYKLYFPDFGTTATGTLVLVPAGEGTRITWSNDGDMGGNPLMHYFALFMDKMVGPDFEAGLWGLKARAEAP
jgi:uncharacterized protein YndB with AHSA1/START domain